MGVCLALSDDEDYVSFDEDDLNAGIEDLYDSGSAEDAASDISNEEYFDSNDLPTVSSNNNNQNVSDLAINPIPIIPTFEPHPMPPQRPETAIKPYRSLRTSADDSMLTSSRRGRGRAFRGRGIARNRRSQSTTNALN